MALIHQFIDQVLRRYPDAGQSDAEDLAEEVESEILVVADTALATVEMYHSLLKDTIGNRLRGRVRSYQKRVFPPGRRQRTDRRRIQILGVAEGTYQRHNVDQLRDLIMVDGVDRLLRKKFKPCRSAPEVVYELASTADLRIRILSQLKLAGHIQEDAEWCSLLVEAIEATAEANTFADVRRIRGW